MAMKMSNESLFQEANDVDFLFSIKEPVLVLLESTAYFLSFAQTIHVMLISSAKEKRDVKGALFYEIMLIFHLILACIVANSAHFNFGRILFNLRMFSLGIEPFMWINAAIFAFGSIFSIKHRKVLMVPELCILAFATPPFITLSGPFSWLLLFVDLAFFTFRVSASVALDLMRARDHITALSVGEALKKLPEGILVSFREKILFMNDSMRNYLVGFGIGGHLVGNVKVWDRLCNLSQSQNSLTTNSCFIKTDAGEALMFSRETRVSGKHITEQIAAVDVTELAYLNEEIDRANKQLVSVNVELSVELNNLEQACKREAAFQMKKRVHDEIGQRLSILHHWLAGSLDDSLTEKDVVNLVSDITSCLRSKNVEAQDELDAVIETFSLAGLEISVNGARDKITLLPEILREAATNALKHGHAKHVWVNMSNEENLQTIEISNDGQGVSKMPEFGSGLKAMAQKVESAGGTLKISSLEPFTINVEFLKAGEFR